MIIDTDSISLDELAALTVRRMPWPEFWAEIRPRVRGPWSASSMSGKSPKSSGSSRPSASRPRPTSISRVGRYIASRPDGQSAWTLKGHLQIIATICNMAVRARALTVSPFATRPICKLVRTGPPEGKRHYSLDEIRRLLELLQADVDAKKGWPAWRARRLQAVAATAVYCGLRATELLRLHAADLDFDRHVVRVVPRGSRGMGLKTDGAGKPVGMPLALEPILRSWLEWRLSAPAELAEKFPPAESMPFLFPCTLQRWKPWTGGPPGEKPLDQLAAAGRRAGSRPHVPRARQPCHRNGSIRHRSGHDPAHPSALASPDDRAALPQGR